MIVSGPSPGTSVPAGADTVLDRAPEEDLVGRPVGRELMGVRVTTGLLEAMGEIVPAGTEELTPGMETTEEEATLGATDEATEGMALEATEGAEEDCTAVDSSAGADTAEEEEAAVGAGSAAVGITRTVEVEGSAAPGVAERARIRRAWRPSWVA